MNTNQIKSLFADATSLDAANRTADLVDQMAIGTRGTVRSLLVIVATSLRLHGQAIDAARYDTNEAARCANGRDEALRALGC